jgi:hypothetical protein
MEYVVQVMTPNVKLPNQPIDQPSTVDAWTDVTVVTVPAKTKRRTVITKAVEQYPPLAESGPASVRVIPAEHAEPIKVEMEQPPPQLKIG